MKRIKPIRTKQIITMIGVTVIAFDMLAFTIDFYRPHSHLKVSNPFPYRILPSPSLKYLDSGSQNAESTQNAPSEDHPEDLKSNSNVSDKDQTEDDDHESRLLSVAGAIEAGDVHANRLLQDPSSRDAILSSARKIRNYRAGVPTGHLPHYLEYEIDRVKVNQEIDRVSPEQVKSWDVSYKNSILDNSRKTENETNSNASSSLEDKRNPPMKNQETQAGQ